MNNVNVLSEKAMTVALNISQWTARRLDRKITDEVNAEHGAVADAGRYNKLLLPKEAVAPITKIVSEARDYHLTKTLPWIDRGARLLPAKLFEEYTAKMRDFRLAFEQAVEHFCDNYDRYVAQRRVDLNGMFNAKDYPTTKEMRSKFAFDVSVMPVPTANDFRVTLGDEQAKAIKDQIQKNVERAFDDAMREPLHRAAELVERMIDRLGAYKPADDDSRAQGVFRDSLVNNIAELADLIPAFNIRGDKQLEQLALDLRDRLCVESAEGLRENDAARVAVRKDAEKILAQVNEFLG